MNSEEIAGEIGRIFIGEARSDVVGLWLVAKWVQDDFPHLTAVSAMELTLDIIRDALSDGRVVPGEFAEESDDELAFKAWEFPVEESITRIRREWTSLGRQPNPGEVVWFVDPALLPVTAKRYPMGKGWKPPRAR